MAGINWVSELRLGQGSTVILGINYSKIDWCDENTRSNNKEFMVTITKRLMQDALVEIPNNAMLLEQLSRVERKVLAGDRSQFSGKQGGKYDDDVVMAFCQLCLLFYKKFVQFKSDIQENEELESFEAYDKPILTKDGFKYRKPSRILFVGDGEMWQ